MKFLLRKGKHTAKPRKFKLRCIFKKDPLWNMEEYNWKVKFSKECWYEREDVEFTGVNKLRGMTFGIHGEKPFGKWGWSKYFVNSALLGWQPNFNDTEKKKINLYLYYDVNGVESREIFKSVNVEQEFHITYIVKKDGVHVMIDGGDSYYMPTKTKCRLGYHLWPYFGGKSVSPQDMIVSIED